MCVREERGNEKRRMLQNICENCKATKSESLRRMFKGNTVNLSHKELVIAHLVLL